MRYRLVLLLAISVIGCLSFVACHSPHVDVSIENQTGEAVRLLEVSYPSASFGIGSLAAGAVLNNRVQVRGEGAVKLTYTNAKDRSTEITSLRLAEKQNGSLRIVLLPDGRAEFHPNLNSAQ